MRELQSELDINQHPELAVANVVELSGGHELKEYPRSLDPPYPPPRRERRRCEP